MQTNVDHCQQTLNVFIKCITILYDFFLSNRTKVRRAKLSSPSQNLVTPVRKHAKFYCLENFLDKIIRRTKLFVGQKFRQFCPTNFCPMR